MSSRVAVIMPYYNEQFLLLKSVISVLDQTHQDWMLFLIDDGSDQDKSVYRTLPPLLSLRIVVIPKFNGGAASARNAGINYVLRDKSFEYVAFCDSDDFWWCNHLKSSLDYLVSTNADVVYSNILFQFPDGTPAVPYGIPQYTTYPGIDQLLKQNFIYISSVVMKRKCLDIGEFDVNLNGIEDWDYWIRLAKNGFKFEKNTTSYITYTCKQNGNGSKVTNEIYNKLHTKHGLKNAFPYNTNP